MLTVENLSKTFIVHHCNGKKIVGCSDLSFHVPQGGAVAIRGPSGAGKSSVLKCIYRTYLPTRGAIHYDSELLGRTDLAALHEYAVLQLRQHEIGYVTQFLKVMPRVPAVDVVAEPLFDEHCEPEAARQRARDLLERLHIPASLFDAFPVTFSGGEQQRVNIARAIISRPRLLLLDEPTASLDRQSVNVVIELLQELRNEGTTMIMIFHDQETLRRLADQTVQLDGRQPHKKPEKPQICHANLY